MSSFTGTLTSPNEMLRCAAGEALGRMAQVVADARFVAEVAQASFERLRNANDVRSRTGHSLALGCLHRSGDRGKQFPRIFSKLFGTFRYVGGMGSAQHLDPSARILLALAEDGASPEVQVWALHAFVSSSAPCLEVCQIANVLF